jgi:hypothetical protein
MSNSNFYPRSDEVAACFGQAHEAFYSIFRGAFTRHRNAAFREWAQLAKIPADVFERQAQAGLLEIPEEDRFLAAYPEFLERMKWIKAGELPAPGWSIGHEAPTGFLSQVVFKGERLERDFAFQRDSAQVPLQHI